MVVGYMEHIIHRIIGGVASVIVLKVLSVIEAKQMVLVQPLAFRLNRGYL